MLSWNERGSFQGHLNRLINLNNQSCHENNFVINSLYSSFFISFFHFYVLFSGGWNNNPSCREFIYTYRRLVARAGVLPAVTANVLPQDGSEILAQEEAECFEFDPALEDLAFSRFQSNVLTYISGWVVRKVSGMLKCSGCRKALVRVPSHVDSDFTLLHLRDNGGLVYPSDDVRKIIFESEMRIRQETMWKMNKAKITSYVLRRLDFHSLFKNESRHFIDTSTLWANHLLSLTKLVISIYVDLRLHHLSKQWNLSRANLNVRQLLNRAVIFRHQWIIYLFFLPFLQLSLLAYCVLSKNHSSLFLSCLFCNICKYVPEFTNYIYFSRKEGMLGEVDIYVWRKLRLRFHNRSRVSCGNDAPNFAKNYADNRGSIPLRGHWLNE